MPILKHFVHRDGIREALMIATDDADGEEAVMDTESNGEWECVDEIELTDVAAWPTNRLMLKEV